MDNRHIPLDRLQGTVSSRRWRRKSRQSPTTRRATLVRYSACLVLEYRELCAGDPLETPSSPFQEHEAGG